ncbi:Uncharacterized membrane protein SpoIIM, required for sporulation [Proteiniborus ethanoligenes]|uniref:Uncharacterized membrane protein SpoIIM, required for sporulation n=1 Tax=Proteiniborus ethanoligenes TaxID=415015 RepID=A0A1H3RJT2_9FIRM|nr:stage II sporulation protein M [Proteiniborus ethanoligenes]SDZ25957.1 Uncharacterized membrane protein SpoIIM, required for sporulation [Proteiniborus ethanoligenes]
MNVEQFIKKNSSSWDELKKLTDLLNKKGIRHCEPKQIKRYLYLFRQSSHQLAFARTHFPGSEVVPYLNALVANSHNHIYSVKKYDFSEIKSFFTFELPNSIKKHKSYIITGAIIFFLGFILSLLVVWNNPQNAAYFMPEEMIQNINWDGDTSVAWDYPLMSSYIMTNNISVAFKAFVLGVTLGIGTFYILFFNGALLGALTALVYHNGNPLGYWSLILPHGVLELTAIFIAGGAGLMLARSILIPRKYSRKHSIIKSARESTSLMLGVIVFLIIAGIIEGFFTPINISPLYKLVFAGFTLVIIIAYFSIPYFKSEA